MTADQSARGAVMRTAFNNSKDWGTLIFRFTCDLYGARTGSLPVVSSM